MMWEGEYLEFASTAKAGYLTRAEAESNWASWKQDMSIARDECGPRGYLRLFVSTKTKVVQFNEVSKDKAFKKEEKLGKKATEQQISERFNMVLSNAGDAGIDDLDEGDTMAKAAHAFGSSGSAADAFDSGLYGVDVADLMHEARSRAKAKKKLNGKFEEGPDEDNEEMDEDEEDEEAHTVAGREVRHGSGKWFSPDKAWFDETKVRKAQRTYLNSVLRLEASLKETQLGMTEVLAEVRRVPADAKDSVGALGLFCPMTPRILCRTFRDGSGRFGICV